MSNYGFRISVDGVDVKTGDDKDMVVTSKYQLLKGSNIVTGSKSVPQNGTKTTVTTAHGLGYIPFVQGFWNEESGDVGTPGYYYPLPTYYNEAIEVFFTIRADATNVYLDFQIDDSGGGGSNKTINYVYYLFINKGNLN